MKNKRILSPKWLLIGLIPLLCILLVTTTIGLKSVLYTTKLFSTGTLTFARVSGNLISGAKIASLSYTPKNATSDGTAVTKLDIQALGFKLSPKTLFTATLSLDDITLTDVKVQFTADQTNPQSSKQNILTKITGKATLSPNTWALTIDTLEGTWQDLKVNGHTILKAANSVVTINSAYLAVGSNFVEVARANSGQLEWQININAIKDFHPEMHGQIHGKGSLRLPELFNLKNSGNKQPATADLPNAITGTIKATNLAFGNYKLKTLVATAEYTATPTAALNLNLTSTGIESNVFKLNDLNFSATGTNNTHKISVDISSDIMPKASLRATGNINNQNPTSVDYWHGNIDTLNIKTKHLRDWKLSAACPIIANLQAITLDKLTLATATGQETLSLAVNVNLKDISAVKLTAKQLPLAWLQPALPDTIKLSSTANLELSANYAHNSAELTAQGNLAISPGQAEFTDKQQQLAEMPFKGGNSSFNLTDNTLNLSANLTADQENYLTGKLQIHNVLATNPPTAKSDIADLHEPQQLTGHIDATINDLSWIMRLCPDITRLKGKITGHSAISGSLQRPSVITKVDLKDGTLRIPTLGVKIKPLTMHLTANDLDKFLLTADGSMRDGPGVLKLSGTFEPFKPGIPNEFMLIGDGVEFVNTANAHLIADSKLKLTLKDLNTLAVAGDIKIVSGTINLDDKKSDSSVPVSSDLVFTDNLPTRAKTEFNIIPNLNLRIEKNVLFKGFGLDADISGKLEITKPAKHLLGNGRISLKTGTYKMPGQTLYISHGRLLFSPGTLLSNPNLDIMMTSTRQTEESINTKENVGLYIHGTVNKPKLQNSGLIGDSQAVNQLLNATSSPVVSKIQDKLALEQFGIESNDENDEHIGQSKHSPATLENKSLVIGKKLTNKIYLQYLKTLVDTNNTVRLKYALSKNWAVGVESGTIGNGADISFAMDRN